MESKSSLGDCVELGCLVSWILERTHLQLLDARDPRDTGRSGEVVESVDHSLSLPCFPEKKINSSNEIAKLESIPY